MYADNEFLIALADKLTEISENCFDSGAQADLNKLIDKIIEQASINKIH